MLEIDERLECRDALLVGRLGCRQDRSRPLNSSRQPQRRRAICQVHRVARGVDVHELVAERREHHPAREGPGERRVEGVRILHHAVAQGLRERVAEKAANLYGAAYDPEHEVTIVPGATYGIFTAVSAFVRPGDEVILFEPAYDSYGPAVEVHGGKPVFVQLTYPDYAIDWDAVRRAVTPRTRALVLNSPHNPTGMMLSVEDVRALEQVLDQTDAIVISATPRVAVAVQLPTGYGIDEQGRAFPPVEMRARRLVQILQSKAREQGLQNLAMQVVDARPALRAGTHALHRGLIARTPRQCKRIAIDVGIQRLHLAHDAAVPIDDGAKNIKGQHLGAGLCRGSGAHVFHGLVFTPEVR